MKKLALLFSFVWLAIRLLGDEPIMVKTDSTHLVNSPNIIDFTGKTVLGLPGGGGGGSGTVTSITATAPAVVTPSPLTTTGVISLNLATDFLWTTSQTMTLTNASTGTADTVLTLRHNSSGTVGGAFGSVIDLQAQSNGGSNRGLAQIKALWSNATDASRQSILELWTTATGGTSTRYVRLFGDGGMALGNTTDPGPGILLVNTGFWVGGSAPANGNVLLSDGAAFKSAAPAALTKTDDTNVTLTLGGSPTTALLKAASITAGWTGQLAISRGGTGAATAGSALSNLGGEPSLGNPVADGQVLSSTSTGTRSWISLPSAPVTSVFTRTGAVTAQSGDYSAFYPLLSGSYANPAWITSLPWSKITSTPTTLAGYGITDGLTSFASGDLSPIFTTTETNTAGAVSQSFSLSGVNQYEFLGRTASGSGAPSYQQIPFTALSGAAATTQGGVPTAGATGQTLIKNSATNYDVGWATPATGDVIGASGAVDQAIAIFSGTTGKLIADSGKSFETFSLSGTATKIPTSQVVKSYADGKESGLGNPGTSGFILSSTTGGTRSWVAPGEPALGNPGSNNQVLASTTAGVRSWISPGTVTSIATTSPVQGGTITNSGTVSLNLGTNFNFSTGQTITISDAGTNAIVNVLILDHNTSATPVAGFGDALRFQSKSDTTAAQHMGQIECVWVDPTQASRTSRINIRPNLNTALQTGLVVFGSGGLSMGSTTDPGSGYMNVATGYKVNNVALSSDNLVTTVSSSAAPAGDIGETIASALATSSATALTTATAKNVTTISLTAGDWDVRGSVSFAATSLGAAGLSACVAQITTTSATITDDGKQAWHPIANPTASAQNITATATLAPRRIGLASTTTVYLVGQASFSSGTMSAYGYIEARRVR